MWVKLGGRWFNTRLMFCIDKCPLEPKAKTIIFPPGADPSHGGFIVSMPLEDVLDKVQKADEDEDDQLQALAEELEEAAGAPVQD